jgi:peptidoglycan/LPS O-acetylase OafA/YrhL
MQRQRDAVGIGVLLFGAYHVALGLLMAIAPGTFFEKAGPFGTKNVHYILDAASWELALGVVLLLSFNRIAWRAPVLGFAVLQSFLHTLNHLIDIDEADPEWVGYFDFFALALGTALLAWLFRSALAHQHVGPERGEGGVS